jgi:hypothetical protein
VSGAGGVELRHVRDGRARVIDVGPLVFKIFLVRFLLPVWFQFEAYEPKSAGD